MGSRKDIEKKILDTLSAIDKTGKNTTLTRDTFKRMSNKEFEVYMQSLKDGDAFINIIIPPLSDIEKGITVDNNLKVAKSLKVDFLQTLTLTDDDISNSIPVLVGYGMFRRVRQTTEKAISVPKDNKSRNTITNESSGKSKGTRISLPETDIFLGHNLKYTMKEFLNARGGDLGASTALISEITRKGSVTQDVTDRFRTGTGAKNVIDSIFKAMHIDISL